MLDTKMGFQDAFWSPVVDVTFEEMLRKVESPQVELAAVQWRRETRKHGGHEKPSYKCWQCKRLQQMKAAGGILIPGGTFNGRRQKGKFKQASGLAVYDVEDFDTDEELDEIKEAIAALPSTALVGRSMSGNSLWVLLRIPIAETAAEYTEHWFKGLEYLKLVRGVSCHVVEQSKGQQDVTRARFLAPDPALYVNLEAEVL